MLGRNYDQRIDVTRQCVTRFEKHTTLSGPSRKATHPGPEGHPAFAEPTAGKPAQAATHPGAARHPARAGIAEIVLMGPRLSGVAAEPLALK
jgi:hypothetical protein